MEIATPAGSRQRRRAAVSKDTHSGVISHLTFGDVKSWRLLARLIPLVGLAVAAQLAVTALLALVSPLHPFAVALIDATLVTLVVLAGLTLAGEFPVVTEDAEADGSLKGAVTYRDRGRRRNRTAAWGLGLVAAYALVAELAVMKILSGLPQISTGIKMVLDALSLVCLLLPVLVLWVYRPLERAWLAESGAEARNAMLRAAIDATSESVVISDPSGRIQYANPAFSKHVGRPLEETLESPLSEVEGVPEPASESMGRRRGIGASLREIRLRRFEDGRWLYEEEHVSDVRDDRGNLVSRVAIKKDVSREVAVESQMVRAQAMEAVGQLAAGAAHDFNNVLAGIVGCAEQILRRVPAGTKEASLLDCCLRACDRATFLTRRLADLANEEMRLEPFRLSPLVRRASDFLRRVIEENVEISLHLGLDPLPVLGDPVGVERILANLCINARDALPDGGTIRIAVGRLGGRVRLSVSDDGCGIPKDVMDRVFEPFFTTKEVGRGTGLGLATVKRLASQMGAEVAIESEVGLGTSVHVDLLSARVDSIEEEQGEESEPVGTERVLLVEDDRLVLRVAAATLQRLGYTVHGADNGERAMELLDGPERFDLVVTDLVMPRLGGKELYERMHPRLRFQQLRWLFISGYRGPDPIQGVDVLSKPFTSRVLAVAVRRALDRRTRAGDRKETRQPVAAVAAEESRGVGAALSKPHRESLP